MIEINGIIYHTAKSAADYLQIPRTMFYANVRSKVQAYQFAARRRLLYKETDLMPFRQVQTIAHVA